MSDHWKPKAVWNEVREKVRGWMDPGRDRGIKDPNLIFHLAFTAPLLLGLAAMLMRHS